MRRSTACGQGKRRRVCRTPEESYAAGLARGQQMPPLTAEQINRLVILLAPHVQRWADQHGQPAA